MKTKAITMMTVRMKFADDTVRCRRNSPDAASAGRISYSKYMRIELI